LNIIYFSAQQFFDQVSRTYEYLILTYNEVSITHPLS